VKESALLLFSLGLWEQDAFFVQESVIIGLVKKMCSFQRIQIALISRKIHTAGLGLFKRHHDESVSCASPIFSFILVSFSINVILFVWVVLFFKEGRVTGRAGSRSEFQVTT